MNTINRSFSRNLWTIGVGAAMAAMLSIAMAANAHGDRVAQVEGTQWMAASAPAARTAAESAWNEAEDLKAGANVGQPGIY